MPNAYRLVPVAANASMVTSATRTMYADRNVLLTATAHITWSVATRSVLTLARGRVELRPSAKW